MTQTNPRTPGLLYSVLAGCLAVSFSSSTATAHDYFPTQVGVLVEYFELDHAALPPLLREYQEQPNANGLLKKVQAMAKEGKSSMIDSTYVVTPSGQRAKIESIREPIYPTEWDPAGLPHELQGPIQSGLNFKTSAGPTAFEMRPVRISVKLDPLVEDDNRNIQINIVSEMVQLVDRLEYGTGNTKAEQPLFESLKISTAVTVPDGRSALIGIHSLETARAGEAATEEEREAVRDRRVLVFLTVKGKPM